MIRDEGANARQLDPDAGNELHWAADLTNSLAVIQRIVEFVPADVAFVYRCDERLAGRPRANAALELRARAPLVGLQALERRTHGAARRAGAFRRHAGVDDRTRGVGDLE